MPDTPALDRRRSGVLLHPSSLPRPGDGRATPGQAERFCDFLAACGFSVWQTLPLNPRDETGSPYRSASVFAIDPALLALDETTPDGSPPNLETFVAEQAYWLPDYALYIALRRELGQPWYDWPAPLRQREPGALRAARIQHAAAIDTTCRHQFRCHLAWARVRAQAHSRGIRLFGDLPFFVAYDSADVWARRDLFQLDAAGRMTANTGVPPDYFSATGQLWGMPHYDWPAIRADHWRWWIERLRRQLALFDLLRLDHFRGLAAAWRVPVDRADAASGRWEPGPGDALLSALTDALGALPLVAEDLGQITADVDALRQRAGLAGMRVLQFAFDGNADNVHLPHNHATNAVVYTGTHDNNTLLGWWREDCDSAARRHAAAYLGQPPDRVPAALQRQTLASVARLAILPMQDILQLGAEARMNRPGTATDNWSWQLEVIPEAPETRAYYRSLNTLYGRLAGD
ncbi:4-alpha-glucanotransferase [Salinisphaera hydrothermalis]|uniref:4-alpha-glucanotransferase n=1 Tax=Salinisphaera hydrothermalis TaxID=563188 RepID=UPI00334094A4